MVSKAIIDMVLKIKKERKNEVRNDHRLLAPYEGALQLSYWKPLERSS
jgi:hypothetical protein